MASLKIASWALSFANRSALIFAICSGVSPRWAGVVVVAAGVVVVAAGVVVVAVGGGACVAGALG